MEHLKFCQSCGMPLKMPADYGTNSDNTYNDEYCGYCFQNGDFTADVSMDEMILNNVAYLKEYNAESGKLFTVEEAILGMKLHFPTLKRWKQKGETVNYYHEAVNKVVTYIDEHLFCEMNLKLLSEIASISEFHFHRIFKAIIGETVAGYIQRIRLEKIAHRLCAENISLTDLAEQTCYGTKYALSKAFKKYFNMSPGEYRKNPEKYAVYREVYSIPLLELTPEIRSIDDLNVIYLSLNQTDRSQESYDRSWRELKDYVAENNLSHPEGKYLSFSFDNPEITSPLLCRYYVCYITKDKVKPSGIFGTMNIKGGTYAIFRLNGAYEELTNLYRSIYNKWLPDHKEYKLRDTNAFQLYIKQPENDDDKEFITDVYIPVEITDKEKI